MKKYIILYISLTVIAGLLIFGIVIETNAQNYMIESINGRTLNVFDVVSSDFDFKLKHFMESNGSINIVRDTFSYYNILLDPYLPLLTKFSYEYSVYCNGMTRLVKLYRACIERMENNLLSPEEVKDFKSLRQFISEVSNEYISRYRNGLPFDYAYGLEKYKQCYDFTMKDVGVNSFYQLYME